ncbi:CDP-alcohol phosphatidyltransferase family protein [Enterovibrio baiacu]|uniref:CDP-alcohol phosphatidyltransferase family protein n=1 Tax=Enterovibrio baiacu TaxID=2491023 RepID=UPI003D0AAEA6
MKFSEFLPLYKQHEKPASTKYHKYVSKNGAKLFSYIAIKLGITPNQVSLISTILIIVGCGLLLAENTALNLLAIAIIQLSYICDCSDGVVARLTKTSSKFGGYLDVTLDRITGLFLYGTIILYSINSSTSENEIYVITFSLFVIYSYQISSSFRLYHFPELKDYMKKGKRSLISKCVSFVYEFIDSGILYLILTLSAIVGILPYVTFIYGLTAVLLFAGNMLILYKVEK